MQLDVVGIRLVKERTIDYEISITSPEVAVDIVANELKDMDREIAMMVNLDNDNKIINAHIVGMGGINYCDIHMPNIFKSAFLSNAKGIMLFHNHPSGKCKPSLEDIQLSEKLDQACQLLGLSMVDSIVIGKNQYYSYRSDKISYYDPRENDVCKKNSLTKNIISLEHQKDVLKGNKGFVFNNYYLYFNKEDRDNTLSYALIHNNYKLACKHSFTYEELINDNLLTDSNEVSLGSILRHIELRYDINLTNDTLQEIQLTKADKEWKKIISLNKDIFKEETVPYTKFSELNLTQQIDEIEKIGNSEISSISPSLSNFEYKNGYLHFSVEVEPNYYLDGIYRVFDPLNGDSQKIVSINNGYNYPIIQEQWNEIESKLYDITYDKYTELTNEYVAAIKLYRSISNENTKEEQIEKNEYSLEEEYEDELDL